MGRVVLVRIAEVGILLMALMGAGQRRAVGRSSACQSAAAVLTVLRAFILTRTRRRVDASRGIQAPTGLLLQIWLP